MHECDPARMQNYLLWFLETYHPKRSSSVTTYWRQLSQLYQTWEGRRMDPKVLKNLEMVRISARASTLNDY